MDTSSSLSSPSPSSGSASGSSGLAPRTSWIAYSHIRWIYVIWFWICLCVSPGQGLYGLDQADYYGECNKFLYSSTIEPPLYRLIELHIRHNFRQVYLLEDVMISLKIF
ncbi:hypothetical protein LSH36_727g00005 [Paralvinella palmiformis]|uniref:Uncharacterized protein n=1 Tax=Paralvinella palmiformis TaxID=53620 RepID=A0AAD9MUQ0_9ANNE|nr:hypothetical protein LSH36_727g00005 [Paralvinella palmiformis]